MVSKGGPESNDNEGIFYIPQSTRTGASQSDAVLCDIQDTRWGGG